MISTTLILANLIWIFYSLLEGVREGFYWHYENMSKKECDFNINPVFNIQRTMVISMMAGVLVHITGWFSLLSILCMILMFSFFHNGVYYYTRNKLSEGKYEKGWTDESITFPSYFTFLLKYNKRMSAFIFGLVAQIFVYIFLL